MPSISLFDYDSALRARVEGTDSDTSKGSETEKLEIVPFERIAEAADKMLGSAENVQRIFEAQAEGFVR
jgi:hypothetical protein